MTEAMDSEQTNSGVPTTQAGTLPQPGGLDPYLQSVINTIVEAAMSNIEARMAPRLQQLGIADTPVALTLIEPAGARNPYLFEHKVVIF